MDFNRIRAQRRAKDKASILSRLEYHGWTGDAIIQSKNLPNWAKDKAKFLAERRKLMIEKEFLDDLMPYLTYIMHEGEEAKMFAKEIFLKGKEAFKAKATSVGHLTDNMGFTITKSQADKVKEFDNFLYTFDTVCNEISKALDKIRV